ncbi:hypothetical protein ACWDZ4_18395 [Streptomyces sp. NPDC003016]
MRHDAFLARVRGRGEGEYADREGSAQITTAVREIPAHRVASGGEAEDLASRLPASLKDALETGGGRRRPASRVLRRRGVPLTPSRQSRYRAGIDPPEDGYT